MKPYLKIVPLLVGCFLFVAITKGQDTAVDMALADYAFKEGRTEQAKELYLKAAAYNDPDAHFALAYEFLLPDSELLYHLSTAARMGHAQAMESTFNRLFFYGEYGPNGINPKLALDIYNEGKRINPNLKFFDEDNKVEILKKCVEAGPFDLNAFFKKYNIPANGAGYGAYFTWELAEEASVQGRFGPPNPELVFQLAMRGGFAPAEKEAAVTETYDNWKTNKVAPFNVCDFITSGFGMGYCAQRNAMNREKELNKRLETVSKKLDSTNQKLLQNAHKLAWDFIDKKASNEEGHGGTGIAAWEWNSIIEQEEAFVEKVEKIGAGKMQEIKLRYTDPDKVLNSTYKQVMDSLPILVFNASGVTKEGLRADQKIWLPYRDTLAKLFYGLNPSISEDRWKKWITEIRIKQLQRVLKLKEM